MLSKAINKMRLNKKKMNINFKQLISVLTLGCLSATSLHAQFSVQGGLHLANGVEVNVFTKDLRFTQSEITGNGSIVLRAADTVKIEGTTSIVPNLVLPAAQDVRLNMDLSVKETLEMGTGNILVSPTGILGIGAGAPATLTWQNTGSVVGRMRRWFNPATNSSFESGLFPVGLASKNLYFTVNYTEAPTTKGYVVAEYKEGIMPVSSAWSYAMASDGLKITNFDDDGYWEITPYDENGVAYAALNETPYTLTIRANALITIIDNTETRLLKSVGPAHDTYEAAGIHNIINGDNSDYLISSQNVVGYSYFNIGSSDVNPLPIELLSFGATCEDETKNIRWSTASEKDAWYFQLEYSSNGYTWIADEEIPATGNSNTLINYEYNLANRDEMLYLRLQQFDIDGNVKTYGPIQVSCTESQELILFPNPTKDQFSMVYSAITSGNVMTVKITDISGKTIKDGTFTAHQGSNLQRFEAPFSPGVYIVELFEEGKLLGRKQLVVN
jgi:hypothetical protein